jgi:hypothetical protein
MVHKYENNELERIWKEGVVAYFSVLSRMTGRSEGDHEILQNSRPVVRDSRTRVLTAQSLLSVTSVLKNSLNCPICDYVLSSDACSSF